MSTQKRWPRVLTGIGSVAVLIGAIDPMEGSILVLLGSGLVALGTYLSHSERRITTYHLWAFVLVVLGVGALWGVSMFGGIGGASGVSAWWAVLLLPYPIGWLMGICGPATPRWALWLGIVVGLWYFGLLALSLKVGRHLSANIVIAVIGLLAIGGCVYRLRSWPRRLQSVP